ncbi:prostatic spermine-binding protein-like [Arachis ipaensis]|uniref:prostatic spermine-binding protein-like n=1 Tax=Arachis ipaensis TaxID=130454 RepID=UPI0007AF1E52|nr:prostatic spermine-binding protein-like [Arachis ipaensis]XP_020979752.1 prostatic spermine-binding protein-like [Arachis ipaensis]
MCRIAELRSHVEMFVVHEVEDADDFPEVEYIDVGGKIEENPRNQLVVYEGEQGQQVKNDNVKQVNEGDNLHPHGATENARDESNSDDDGDDEELFYNEEEYDDESGFEELTSAKDGDQVDKGQGVMNGDFSDEEDFNSDEIDLDYEVGGGSDKEDRQEEDNYETRRYPIHKDVKDMTSYK